MNLAHIRYVIAVAENGSFRRAARVLSVQQSSVSRAIRDLEDKLGVSLFERPSSGARLTNAGKRFLSDTRPAIERLDLAKRTAAVAGRAETGIIRIGILTSLAGGFLRTLIDTYTKHAPEVRLEVHEGSRAKHVGDVQRHRIDIAFLSGADSAPDCETEEFWYERVHVALPNSHALAQRQKLDWPDLQRERFIVSRFAPGPEVYDYIASRTAGYGGSINASFENVAQATLMNLVSLGQGITFVSSAWTSANLPGLVLRPLTDQEDIIHFSAIWSQKNDNPALRQFVSLAHVLAGRLRRGSSDWSFEEPGSAMALM